AQILLGGGPAPDKLRIEISLAMQRVALVTDGVPVYHARCSTGRAGYSTKRGEFVITNKERNHRSTIYHVELPHCMRLSCLDFGMQAGIVPNYPAEHGCIRLQEDTARKYFSEIPVGTLVTVQQRDAIAAPWRCEGGDEGSAVTPCCPRLPRPLQREKGRVRDG